MKIGLVRRGYSSSGGAEQFVQRFAAALCAAGHIPVLFATSAWPESEWQHGPLLRVSGGAPEAFAGALERLDPHSHCDVLFSLERLRRCDVYRAGDGVHRAWLRRRAEYEPGWKAWVRQWNPKHRQLLRLEDSLFADGNAGRVIANSRMVAEEIISEFGYPTDLVTVVYNGLPQDAFIGRPEAREPLRKELGLGAQDRLILFAGSGWERKGLRFAVEAVKRLPARCRAVLVVAGRGDAGAFDKRLVRFLGPVRNVQEWMEAADAFVLPTVYDPFSNASLEAHAAGLPVVTTRANGFAEVLADGETGSVIDRPDAIDALAAALEFWCDPRHGEGGRDRIRSAARRFTIEANLKQTLAVMAGEASGLAVSGEV